VSLKPTEQDKLDWECMGGTTPEQNQERFDTGEDTSAQRASGEPPHDVFIISTENSTENL